MQKRYLSVGPATYTNGTLVETFPQQCGDSKQLAPGGTLTFVVQAGGDILDNLHLSIVSLPAGATFPTVNGVIFVQSTFTWTPPGLFVGDVVFNLNNFLFCTLSFDWTLPVELSSFTSYIYGNNVSLNWQTTSENNNSRFEIEKAKIKNGNVQDWIQSGSVPGKGTTPSPSSYTFIENGLNSGVYQYRLKQVDYNGSFAYYYLTNNVEIGEPVSSELSQNYPNPFNPSTMINFDLTMANHVSLKVYNSAGIEVKTIVEEYKNAGYYTVTFDGINLASGIYYYKLVSGNFVSVKNMILLK